MGRGGQSSKLTREELYAQVWAEPMSKLAKRYGLSDRGLAKTCARMGIPVPGRGYWARVQSGQVPPQAKLAKIKVGQRAVVVLNKRGHVLVETNEYQKEKARREKYVPTPAEQKKLDKDRWYHYRLPDDKFYPSGHLSLKLETGYGSGLRSTWADGKHQRVETCLNKFIATVSSCLRQPGNRSNSWNCAVVTTMAFWSAGSAMFGGLMCLLATCWARTAKTKETKVTEPIDLILCLIQPFPSPCSLSN